MEPKSSPYQVIARKYRPQDFKNVLCQEAIVTTLKNALRFQKFAHAYLFCGCRGTGKTTLARVFAKALNCQALTNDLEPCNLCPSCVAINEGRSLDMLEIDGASNRGIEDIRQINETIGYAPTSGKFKIYLIDEVHMLTKEAFNALLKTLEEPPAHVKFFFATTEPHKILQTILSRCQRFDLQRISTEGIKKKLAWIAQDLNIAVEEDALSIIAHLSEGALRDAESLMDQVLCYGEPPITAAQVSTALGLVSRGSLFALDEAFESTHLPFAFELAEEIFASGKEISHFLDSLVEHYRTLLKLKLTGSGMCFSPQEEAHYQKSSKLYTQEQCLYILDLLLQWQGNKTTFKRITLEMILLQIIRSKLRISPATLVKSLTHLQQELKNSPLEKSQPFPKSEPLQSEVQVKQPLIQEKVEVAPVCIPQETVVVATSKEESLPQNFDKEAPQNSHLEGAPIAAQQGAREDENVEEKQAPSKTDSSSNLGIVKTEKTIHQPAHYDTLIRFAAVELEGILK